jgi:hypothetical protein
MFYGTISFEGGDVELNNADGFFDDFGDKDIYGAEVRIYYGSDTITAVDISGGDSTTDYDIYAEGGDSTTDYDFLSFEGKQFEVQYTGTLEDYQITKSSITINFIDTRKFLSTKVPSTLLTKDEYPYLSDTNDGMPIPIGYGVIKRGVAYCVDEAATVSDYTFIFADHPVTSIEQVYVNDKTVAHGDEDLANATFTISDTDYESGDKVTIDFTGYDIENPLDILKDILINHTSLVYNNSFFNTTKWDSVTFSLSQRIGLWIGEKKKEIVKIVEEISSTILGILYIQGDGLYSFKLRDISASPVDTIYISDVIEPVDVQYLSGEYINSARVEYSRFWSLDRGRYYTDDSRKDSLFSKYRKNSEKEFPTLLVDKADAETFATDALDTFGGIFPSFTITTTTAFIEVDIADIIDIEVQHNSDGSSELIRGEVTSKTINLNDYTITFTIRFLESFTDVNIVNIIRYTSSF